MCVCVCVCVCVWADGWVYCIVLYVCILHTSMYRYTHVSNYPRTHTCILHHILKYTRMHTHTYIHKYWSISGSKHLKRYAFTCTLTYIAHTHTQTHLRLRTENQTSMQELRNSHARFKNKIDCIVAPRVWTSGCDMQDSSFHLCICTPPTAGPLA